jgi:hypothetical protein
MDVLAHVPFHGPQRAMKRHFAFNVRHRTRSRSRLQIAIIRAKGEVIPRRWRPGMSKFHQKFARIDAIIGDDDASFAKSVGKLLKHLQAHLQLPCEVKGIEDFRWEEPYIFGGFDPEEYQQLKKTCPSYADRFQLLAIKKNGYSEWMLCAGEDIVAHVQRVRDGKKFALGLSELKATDRKSPNFQLLDDFSVFFWNSR